MVLSKKLKEAREKAKLTQKTAATLTGFSNTTISNWETGVSRPDVDSLSTLCKIYKVRPNDVLEWDSSGNADGTGYGGGDAPGAGNADGTGYGGPGYYINPETAQIAQELYDNPDKRVLLDASRKATPDEMRKIIDMVKIMVREDEKNQ
jgi:transcriptional regulator with XRE-family HTH domain